MSHEPDRVGPSAWLGEHEPPEDSGAQTQSRFRFQHECTARSCVGMLVLDRVASVVCEEHEDFVVIYADGAVELVSVKHRENSKGPWTFARSARKVVSGICTAAGLRPAVALAAA